MPPSHKRKRKSPSSKGGSQLATRHAQPDVLEQVSSPATVEDELDVLCDAGHANCSTAVFCAWPNCDRPVGVAAVAPRGASATPSTRVEWTVRENPQPGAPGHHPGLEYGAGCVTSRM